ncbi:hypothetical protein [Helicobacter labacensis]|uniref:hypothetical protein n=1 Tax=Helicobacter labacensis TaxID=2316079 RepID=UPI000EACA17C|nr:hypothetical protein [Helicobacter labacensis]
MANFLIVHVNGQIGVGEFKPSGFEVLRFDGELWQEFDSESFWEWFMDKAEPDLSAEHGFVIVSDQENFTIATEIRIATSLDLSQEAVQQALGYFVRSAENLNLMTYPEGLQIAEGTQISQNQQTPQTSVPQNNLSDSEQCGPILRLCEREMEKYRKK